MPIKKNKFKSESTTIYQYWAKVCKIIDGDTVDLEISLGFEITIKIRARLIGIAAPEIFGVKKTSNEYKEGMKSKNYLQSLIPKDNWIEIKIYQNKQREKYGRWLAELFSKGVNLNQKMVKSKRAKKIPS